jgi:dolichol-phosphate mannosyltransferase
MLSIIIPAYNEGENINIAADTISKILQSKDIKFEIVFADDGSADDTWKIITKRANADSNIRGFPAISGKKRQYLQDLKRRRVPVQ